MKPKFKVGDKVRIKTKEWYDANKYKNGCVPVDNTYFTPSMAEYCGREAVITEIENLGVFHIDIYNSGWRWDWTPEMFEETVIEQQSPESKVFWYAVDEDGCSSLFKDKPVKRDGVWHGDSVSYFESHEMVQLFPSLTYEDEPMQIEIRKV